MMRTLRAVLMIGLVACTGTRAPAPSLADAEPLRQAMHALSGVIVYDIFSPPQASRVYAYSSIAAFEVLRQGDSSFRSLAGQLRGWSDVPPVPVGVEVSLPLAGVHAFLSVGRELTFSRDRMDSIRTASDKALGTGLPRAVVEASLAYGDTVARRVLAWAGKDGFRESRGMPKYSVEDRPGRWIPTPPAYMDAVEPNWGTLRPFVLDSASQFRPAAPHPFSTATSSPFMQQVKEVYETGKNLTDEQRAIASFWDCNPYVMNVQGHTMFATKKITPGGHWMGIVGIASRQAAAGLVQTAALFAHTAVAIADGFISAWDMKYATNVLRPETVINKHVDEGWVPLLQTPPFPEYTSGHSVISNAAAEVLTRHLGNTFAFADSTEVEYGLPVRSFTSFKTAAEEAAISRLYGGIHYRQAIDEGSTQGRRVGVLVADRVQFGGAAAAVAQR